MTRLGVLDRPAEPRSAAEDRAAKVLMTAADLMYRNGFDATSMNDIAKAVNLTKAGLYYYTKSKNDLLYKIISFAMDCVERDIIRPSEEISEAEERLQFIIQAHLKSIFVSGGVITILTEEIHKLSPTHRQNVVAREHKYLDLVRGTLQELKKTGRLRDLDVTIAALNMFASILGIVRWYDAKGRFSSDRVAAEISQFIMSGLLHDKKSKA